MRIAFDITPLAVPQSGVGTYTANLLAHLYRQTEDQILPLIHRPLALAASEIEFPAPSVRSPWGRLNKTLWMQMLLPWQLSRLRPDVAHFTNSVAPLYAPCPTVITIHDMTLWLFPEHHYRRRLLAMRPFIPIAARRAGAIIAVSHSAKADIVRILGVPAEKVHVVYEAPPPAFRLLAPGPLLESVRREYHLPERFLLYVGTLEPRKNLVRLLEAFAYLRRAVRLPHTLLVVGRRGWKEDAIFEAVERLALGDAVRFLDYVPTTALVALYNLAEALAFPSLYEGFGLPVVEAMACGTPVVTSERGSLGEIAGGAAQFVEPTNVESIAAGLHTVLNDEFRRAELRVLGLAHVAALTWVATARQTRQVYEGALER
ncbi:MAG: glycosyltransferase family 4 protein [Ardenticatenales bacterium]|nr:glycosyltransferase family 4 protein [Ardenticatenales bacterium]